jgi:hypothetical protein
MMNDSARDTVRILGAQVWFTVAGGVLSDVFWANVDATNVRTLQYLVAGCSRLQIAGIGRPWVERFCTLRRSGLSP